MDVAIYARVSTTRQAEHDISPYLDCWLAASSVNAHRNLTLMIFREGVPNLLKPDSGYWGQRREQWQQTRRRSDSAYCATRAA